MPRHSKNETINGRYFRWKLARRDGAWTADGRSGNCRDLGRRSLGTRDRNEALQLLRELDVVQAVENGLADESALTSRDTAEVDLNQGVQLYMADRERPEVAEGVSAATRKRYRAVFDKFAPFARKHGILHWAAVTKAVLLDYLRSLEKKGYAQATLYLEATTVKQLIRWLVGEQKLSASALISLTLRKPAGSNTYCWRPEEVTAMIDHCRSSPALEWLGDVIVALALTGMRISELGSKRWADIDFDANIVRISNDPDDRKLSTQRRRTKNRRDRMLPIHSDLRKVLERIPGTPTALCSTVRALVG